MSLIIIVPLHSRDNAAKVAFAVPSVDRFEVETAYKVELSDFWKFYSNFVNPAFQNVWSDNNY